MWNSNAPQCYCNGFEACHACNNDDFDEVFARQSLDAELEELLDEHIDLEHGLQFLLSQGMPDTDPNIQYHIERLSQVENELKRLRTKRRAKEKEAKVKKKHDSSTKKADEVDQLCNYLSQATKVDVNDQLSSKKHAATKPQPVKKNEAGSTIKSPPAKIPPTSVTKKPAPVASALADMKPAAPKKVRKLKACNNCGDSSKYYSLMKCSGCHKVVYCSQKCQKADWPSHKALCQAAKKERAPLSWQQLEEYGGMPARGKTLEVTFVRREPGLRLVALCRDSKGDFRRVAAYTTTRNIDGFVPGMTLRWKNPRYHYFLDGSGGARIENEDLKDVRLMQAKPMEYVD